MRVLQIADPGAHEFRFCRFEKTDSGVVIFIENENGDLLGSLELTPDDWRDFYSATMETFA